MNDQTKPDAAPGEEEEPHTTPSNPWNNPPLSSGPVIETVSAEGYNVRVDTQGRLLCNAKRRDGEKCKSPVVMGMRVCRMHGAKSPRAKNAARLRLAELVDPAIATLAREMTQADKSADKQRAANSILDRAGHGRQQKIEVADAKELLYQKLRGYIDERDAEPEQEG